MKVIHLISGGDSGGAKTHVLSLLQNLNKSITAQLVCFRDGPFADEARALGIPTMMDAAALAGVPGLVLTPRDLDGVIRRGAVLLAGAINQALQPRLTLDELDYLVS